MKLVYMYWTAMKAEATPFVLIYLKLCDEIYAQDKYNVYCHIHNISFAYLK